MITEDRALKISWLVSATGVKIVIPGDTTPPDPTADIRDEWRRKNEELDLADEQRKQVLLAGALRTIEPLKKKLAASMAISQSETTKRKILPDKKVTRDYTNPDLTEVADTRDIRQNTSFERPDGEKDTGKIAKEAQRSMQIIDGLKLDLEKHTTYRMEIDLKAKPPELLKGKEKPLFTEDEIITEIYDPLQRSGIMPDGLIENKMSRNKIMIDATNDIYKKDLSDPTKGTTFGFKGMMKAGVDIASNIATSVLQAKGLGSSTDIKTLLKASTEAAKALVDGGDLFVEAVSGRFKLDDLQNLINELPALIGDFVSGGTGNTNMGTAVTAGLKGGFMITDEIFAMCQDNPDKAVSAFAAGLGNLLTMAANVESVEILKDQSLSKTEQTDKTALPNLVGTAGGLFAAMAAGTAPKLVAAIRNRNKSSIRSLLIQFADDSAGSLTDLVTYSAEVGDKEKNSSKKSATVSDDKTIAGDVTSGVKGLDPGLSTASKNLDSAETLEKGKPKPLTTERQEALKKLREKYDKEQADAMYKELEERAEKERKTMGDLLLGLGKPSQNAADINKMIATMQRDQALLALLMAIGSGGAAVAAAIVPQLGVIGDAIKLYQSLKKALDNAEYIESFLEEQQSARGVSSRYGGAIDNFLKNQQFQYRRNQMATAMAGLQLVADAVASAYPLAAPATPAVKALGGLVDLGFQGKQAADLARAWKQTKAALDDPENRRLAQAARKMNPTLAKYTLAYGATEERDPIAISMANACGLDDATLRNPKAGVDTVKKYFEVKFADDPTLTGYYKDKAKWQEKLPAPAITKKALVRLYATLAEQFKEKVPPLPPSELTGLVAQLEKPPTPEEELNEKAMTARRKLAEMLDETLREAGGTLTKAAGDTAIAEIFNEFAEEAFEIAFAAFMKLAEIKQAEKK